MVFSEEELDAIIRIGDNDLDLHHATMVGKERDKKYRKSMIGWMDNPDHMWIVARLYSAVKEYGDDIHEVQSLQYTIYQNGGHYDWHVDVSKGTKDPIAKRRVITGVLQLSDPNDYVGGALLIRGEGGVEKIMTKQRGHLIVFPAYVEHKVAPVTKGTRRSLVFWGLRKEQ